MEKGECKGCPCHKMGGILIFLFGLTFLLGYLGYVSQQVVHIAWPIIIMLGGLKAMMKGSCKCCSSG